MAKERKADVWMRRALIIQSERETRGEEKKWFKVLKWFQVKYYCTTPVRIKAKPHSGSFNVGTAGFFYVSAFMAFLTTIKNIHPRVKVIPTRTRSLDEWWLGESWILNGYRQRSSRSECSQHYIALRWWKNDYRKREEINLRQQFLLGLIVF